MKVTVTITREYEMDEARVLAEPSFEPPSPDAALRDKQAWLRESFYELCGWQRDRDHIDGSYVSLMYETDDHEFDWPDDLRAATSQSRSEA